MAIQPITKPQTPAIQNDSERIDWTLGWRYEEVLQPDGGTQHLRIPLTAEEALHPKEGYIMPERKKHDDNSVNLRDMLMVWALDHPAMTIFHDLIFEWDHPEVGNYAPDIAVVPNVRNPHDDRGTFVVAEEGTRPVLVIEIVSPKTQKADREDKVIDYARVGIQEYIYIDTRHRKRGTVWEVVGYRLVGETYQRLPVDEDGAVFCETINARIGIDNGIAWIEDRVTGQDLLNNLEAQVALRAARERISEVEEMVSLAEERIHVIEERAIDAEEKAQFAEERAKAAEEEIAKLKAKYGLQ